MNEHATQVPARVADEVRAEDFLAPPTVPHYEPGPKTTRMIERGGVLWEVTYFAEHDTTGWLVKSCTCRPIESGEKFFDKGGRGWIAITFGLDYGAEVDVSVDGPGGTRKVRIYRSMIRHVETWTPEPQTVGGGD